ncbi:unnamed protein product [Cercopithifilaria johnstoni]|uniref:Uncharacterized protein n=1 Tax=Cercopithifilaria johnstoni TaxID=2874296 RepID=A0A8J2Q3N7_9BILA|nr:unnamed protein product [Cercopithifilaria johnstoni]
MSRSMVILKAFHARFVRHFAFFMEQKCPVMSHVFNVTNRSTSGLQITMDHLTFFLSPLEISDDRIRYSLLSIGRGAL